MPLSRAWSASSRIINTFQYIWLLLPFSGLINMHQMAMLRPAPPSLNQLLATWSVHPRAKVSVNQSSPISLFFFHFLSNFLHLFFSRPCLNSTVYASSLLCTLSILLIQLFLTILPSSKTISLRARWRPSVRLHPGQENNFSTTFLQQFTGQTPHRRQKERFPPFLFKAAMLK